MTSPNQLSFLPDDYLERKQRRRSNVICAALLVIVLAAVCSAFLLRERVTRGLIARHEAVKRQYEEAAKRLEQVQQMQEKQKRMAHQAELTASLIERVPRSFVLAEITNALPPGVSLLDFMLDSKVRNEAPAVVAKTIYEQKQQEIAAEKRAAEMQTQIRKFDVNIKLTGVAGTDVQVAQFINRLNRSSLLRDVNLVIVDEFPIQEDKFRKFQLEMVLNPDADVKNPTSQPTLNTASAVVPLEK